MEIVDMTKKWIAIFIEKLWYFVNVPFHFEMHISLESFSFGFIAGIEAYLQLQNAKRALFSILFHKNVSYDLRWWEFPNK